MAKKVLFIVIVFSLILFVVINIKAPLSICGDGVFYYSWLHSIVYDHDLNFKNQLEYFSNYDIQSALVLKYKTTPLGKVINPYAYGIAIMIFPFFSLAHILSWIFSLPTNGYSYFYVLFLNFATWVYGTLSIIIIYKILKRFFSQLVSLKSTLLIFLATPWIYYQFLEPSMAHIISLFLVSCFLYLFIKQWQGEKVSSLLMGIVIFLMVVTRWQSLLLLLIFLPLWWQDRKQIKKVFQQILKTIIPIICFIVIQMFIWKVLYGQYLLVPQGMGFIRWDFHGLYILFSSNRGLLLWSPIIILAFLGFYYLWRKSKFLFIITISAFVVQWLINGSLNDLGGGDAFGARRFIEVLPFLALALSAFYQKFKFKKVLSLVVIVLIIWNIILIENYRHGFIPHQGEFNIYQVNYLEVISHDINKYLK